MLPVGIFFVLLGRRTRAGNKWARRAMAGMLIYLAFAFVVTRR